MKLVKFISCDAPAVAATAIQVSVDEQRVRVFPNRNSGNDRSKQAVKSWRLHSATPSTSGCYWLLNDDNTPIGPIDEVLLASRDNESNSAGVSVPNGVEESHIDGVDLRSKMGKQLQRTREEYGQTFKTAAKNAALLMDAERLHTGREEKKREERKRVVEAIENGEEPVRATRVKAEGGKKGGSEVTAKSTSKRR
ncbi:hypothetical protein DQ04_00041120 [Trypanosoma grayi]|uniref:hypothetical protein n=1 Tax=Trypanosoma grayi TaxID=71804 RepID=UPI0004F452DA|nr:hypothetical protein DQ04_00041120 [Trypanosoma grayi]KEG15548.1 hypothetical protein DQ04_00041120 [Trypanosoma grayi]